MRLLELTEKDLEANSYWVYEGDNDKTAKIRPAAKIQLVDEKAYIAKADFTLSDGSKLTGYCSPEDDSGMDYTQPTILANGKHFNLFEFGEAGLDIKAVLCIELKKDIENVFPILVECIVPERNISFKQSIG